jgi:hypothetical protein
MQGNAEEMLRTRLKLVDAEYEDESYVEKVLKKRLRGTCYRQSNDKLPQALYSMEEVVNRSW